VRSQVFFGIAGRVKQRIDFTMAEHFGQTFVATRARYLDRRLSTASLLQTQTRNNCLIADRRASGLLAKPCASHQIEYFFFHMVLCATAAKWVSRQPI
jgi:hypothetical protein